MDDDAEDREGAARLSASDDPGLFAREIQSFIVRNPNIFGVADILCVDFKTPRMRAAMLAAVLTGLVEKNGRPAVHSFTIVAPPGTDISSYEDAAWEEFVQFFELLAEREMQSGVRAALRARFHVVAPPDRRSRSLLDIIEGQQQQTAVIVTEATAYRDSETQPFVAPGAETPLLEEDVWAPQLHSLAAQAVALARTRTLYVALDADRQTPCRQQLADLLLSVEGCGVMGSDRLDDPARILAERVDQWHVMLREGQLGRVLGEIDALPRQLESNKSLLRIQILDEAGLVPQALEIARQEIEADRHLDPWVRVKLARIASDANADGLAKAILAPALDQLSDREYLESALSTARDIGASKLEKGFAQRLEMLFPDSRGLRQRRIRKLLDARDYAGVASLMAGNPDERDGAHFYEKLADTFSVSGVPDYRKLIDEAGDDRELAEAYRMACAGDALNRKLLVHALDLALPIPTTDAQSERGSRLLMSILEAIFLAVDREGELAVPKDDIIEAVAALIVHLARQPDEQADRVRLAQVLQPALAGTTGLAALALVVIQLGSGPIRLDPQRPHGKAHMAWLMERKPFVRSAFEWMQREQLIVMGRAILPASLLTEAPDEVVSAIADYLHKGPIETAEDRTSLQKWLALATAIVPHGSDPDRDLALIRLAATRLASAGRMQDGRDLAEQAILISATTPRRRRLGWLALADTYHRCHNHIEALIAMGCTFAADDGGDEDQIWLEITAMARLLRDMGLLDLAMTAVGVARRLLKRATLPSHCSLRLDTLELQIRQVRTEINGLDPRELEPLLIDIVDNAKAVLQTNEMTEPAGIMLAQVVRKARKAGISVPGETDALLADLTKHASRAFRPLVDAIGEETPSAEDLARVLRMIGQARYSDDVGFDMRNLAIMAGRALVSDTLLADPVATSFALELLADRGVAIPGWDGVAEPPPAPQDQGEPAEIAQALSRNGISLVQAGFDAAGRLVRLFAVDGELQAPVRESDELINEARFKAWAKDYPYAYGIDEDTANLFYTTTADLRLSDLPKGPVLVVADAAFQPFPPNLLYVEDDFVGRTRAMAAAPSLSWLKAAMDPGRIGDGRKCAWISTATGKGGSPTLPTLAARLEPTLTQHGFLVDNGPVLPSAFAGSSMTIITAHGGVHPDGRYFQVVSDEGSLRVTAGDLANALRNVGVVVLFVCSGGRTDKHPGANTTLGLAKQILDRGCTAVVASPWPLDSRVPSHWLPVFLEQWSKGARLLEANHAANKIVDQHFALDPARGLAMSVFGNPFVRDPS